MKNLSVGKIVADNFATAAVFSKYGIDFCCHGDVLLSQACKDAGVNPDEVEQALQQIHLEQQHGFSSWPLDLLIDYVLKIHHRGIRRNGPEILVLMNKVLAAHGEAHPELLELHGLFVESLKDLESHLQKEENVLFPYLLELFAASEEGRTLEQMHCGTVKNPIRVMRMEHEGEGDRYHRISELTNGFCVPADGCGSYRLLMERLKKFVNDLYEHIHLENNVIFPQAVALEEKWVD